MTGNTEVDLYTQLKTVLLSCEAFDSDANLKAVFVDPRINTWKDTLPQAGDCSNRVAQLIAYLDPKVSRNHENALVLFLWALSDTIPKGDRRHQQLVSLASELEHEKQSAPTFAAVMALSKIEAGELANAPRINRLRDLVWPSVGSLVIGAILMLLALSLLRPTAFPFISKPTPTPDATSTSVLTEPVPLASLVSMRYMTNDFEPRMVDLRTVSTSGIPADWENEYGYALRLFDFWVLVPENAPGYTVGIEVYANDELIGTTQPQAMEAGVHKWQDLVIKNYKDGKYCRPERPDHWRLQPDWKTLEVTLVVYKEEKKVNQDVTPVLLSDKGQAWILDPPNLHFVSVVYTVNDGPAKILDFRTASEDGIGAVPGDKLTILEVWYNVNALWYQENNKHIVKVEAFLGVDQDFDADTDRATPPGEMQEGIQRLPDVSTLNWVIPEGRGKLVLWLLRRQGEERSMIVDEIVVPLSFEGDAGLVSRAGAVSSSQPDVQLLDFEQDADIEHWSGDVQTSSETAFAGNQSLRISFPVMATTPDMSFAAWNQSFTADKMVVYYYLPSQPEVYIEWIQFCVIQDLWYCNFAHDRTKDQWHALVFDFAYWPEDANPPLSERELLSMNIHGVIQAPGATEPVTYSMYLDAIQIFDDEDR